MRFYAVYAPIANRPGHWSRQGELFTDCGEAAAAMSEMRLQDAVIVGGEELCDFHAALLGEEVERRRVVVAAA